MGSEIEKFAKQHRAALSAAEKLGDQLRGWASELAALEGQCELWSASRIDALAEGKAAEARKLDKHLAKAGKQAADLRALVARQRPLIQSALERAEAVWAPSGADAYAADENEKAAAIGEIARLELDLGYARGRLQRAIGRLTASSNFESDALDQRNRAAWLASEFARLTGQAVAENVWRPAWLEPEPALEPLPPLVEVKQPAMRGETAPVTLGVGFE